MAETTRIEWCDATFNPWIGCAKVSPGCDNCYAAAQDKFRSWTPEGWGAGKPRHRTSESNWAQPNRWNAAAAKAGERRRVFCSSLADVFDNEVPPVWRLELFALIAATENLDWLILTKRVGNAARLLTEAMLLAEERGMPAVSAWILAWLNGQPPRNVWLGATIVDQEEADRDIPKLLVTPARVRFLSMEPLLAPVTLRPEWLGWKCCVCGERAGSTDACNDCDPCIGAAGKRWVDWIIVGGESGHGARPFAVEWARDIVRQCRAAGVQVHVKQLGVHVITNGVTGPGEHWPDAIRREDTGRGHFRVALSKKGGDMAEWPEDLRVREFPQ